MLQFDFPVSDPLASCPKEWFPDPGQTVFFDIETTGLSWRSSHLYLLGAVFCREGSWYLRQWFCQRPSDEAQVLEEFSSLTENCSLLIHFNGNGFDVPYLMHRYTLYQKEHPFHTLRQMDLYHDLLPWKQIMGLPHMRQRNLEEYAGIHREDPFSGKELIACYQEYLKTGDERLRDALLLHNREDVEGMLGLLPLLLIPRLFSGQIPLHPEVRFTAKEAAFDMRLPVALAAPLKLDTPFCSLQGKEDRISLTVPFFQGTLKLFYENYKDYFYLPLEDVAIHKSVGAYVDPDHRKPATAASCFQKVSGLFLPQTDALFTPSFRREYRSWPMYFQAKESDFQDPENVRLYVTSLLENFRRMLRPEQ